jgi:ADP-heptose:LPS heptosyltransferase
METLIIKLSATGDVVRTTPLLDKVDGEITWITAEGNVPLVDGVAPSVRVLSWGRRAAANDRQYDLLINLEDEFATAEFAGAIDHRRLYGAYKDGSGSVRNTEDSNGWFDLSLISRFGRKRADELKLRNRRCYQDLVFEGLGWKFADERYRLPRPVTTSLHGDVALAPIAGPAWPMKNWAYYSDLQRALASEGLVVNVLPKRPTLLEHLGDIANHRLLVSGDSLPMHFALGLGIRCVTIFNCTSPWEIHGYGLQEQVVSPRLEDYFYRRDFDPAATQTIPFEDVLAACHRLLPCC